MTNEKFSKLFNNSVRNPEHENLNQFHMDIAASVQKVIEEVLLKITSNIAKEYKIKNLCMAGGVALNCVANSKILKSGYFENLWIQPASGDAGGALGAALLAWYDQLDNERVLKKEDKMKGSLLGPEYTTEEIKISLEKSGAKYELLDENSIIETTAKALSDGKAIGWSKEKWSLAQSSRL